jgi:hypothetical protein
MNRNMGSALIIGLAGLTSMSTTEAALVTLTLSGRVLSVDASLSGDIAAGDAWSATAVYDDSTSSTAPGCQSCVYAGAVVSFSLNFPTLAYSKGGSGNINVANDTLFSPGDLADNWILQVNGLVGPELGLGAPRFGLVFEQRNAAPTFLSSGALVPPDLSHFRYAFVQFLQYEDAFLRVDELSVSSVPIPAAAWLLLSGLTGLIAVARRRAVVTA